MDNREALITAARAAADRVGVDRLSLGDFRRETGYSMQAVYRAFEGWHALCAAAGIRADKGNRRVPEEEIFTAMRDVFLSRGRICPQSHLLREVPFGSNAMRGRFRSWHGALVAFHRWARENAPDFPLMAALESRIGLQQKTIRFEPAPPAVPAWPPGGGRASGEVLAFRAMVFAPITEAGVIALFGMAAAELGYRIETVAPGFPDCTARRHVGDGRWEGVRIEFEYRSQSFRAHGHDPNGCDMIVCWEHDWPDCPVEVLALREAIAALPNR